jgi:hypothetical protein
MAEPRKRFLCDLPVNRVPLALGFIPHGELVKLCGQRRP